MPTSSSRGRAATAASTDAKATATDDAPPEGRRARQRRELLAAIEAEARRLLLDGGPGTVSMRAIAREVGVAPASLYTYFEGLDDVFTMLLLSSYRRLAAATAAAAEHFADEPPEDRSFAAILAHRRWALDHRNEFNLLFTDQLPGYAAPEGGPTIEAQAEVFRPMLAALAQLDPGHPGDPGDPGDELAIIQDVGVAIWAAFHGAVSLEVNHHLDWIADPAAVHERVVRGAFESAGIPAPSATMRRRFERWASSALS